MEWSVIKLLFQSIRLRLLMPTVIVALLAILVCYIVQCNRKAYDQLQQTYSQRNDIDVKWGQLLLQYGTLTSYGRIEYLAKEKLNMIVPEQRKVILVKP